MITRASLALEARTVLGEHHLRQVGGPQGSQGLVTWQAALPQDSWRDWRGAQQAGLLMPPRRVGTSPVLTDTRNGGSKLPGKCGERSGRRYCLPEISLGHLPLLKQERNRGTWDGSGAPPVGD